MKKRKLVKWCEMDGEFVHRTVTNPGLKSNCYHLSRYYTHQLLNLGLRHVPHAYTQSPESWDPD
jgi:hypothetical protein